MKHWNLKRVLSLLLVVCMVTGLLSGVSAMAEDQTANYHEISTDGLKLATEDNAAADETETEEAPYADTDVVRVFVVLEDKPVLQQGYATRGIAGNAAAMAVSKALEAKQAALAAEISANVLSGETLNVHWNLTLAANAMSVDLPYGKMDEVEALKGVKSVMLVPQYSIDPREQADLNTISSGNMIGSYNAWLEGYTGAGSRIAIVDTGLDSDHPSFNSAAFDYSLLVTSTKNGKQIADYDLLTAAKINEVLPQLHAAERYEGLTGNALYVSSKIAFGFNYIDATLDITHDNDQQGELVVQVRIVRTLALPLVGVHIARREGCRGRLLPDARTVAALRKEQARREGQHDEKQFTHLTVRKITSATKLRFFRTNPRPKPKLSIKKADFPDTEPPQKGLLFAGKRLPRLPPAVDCRPTSGKIPNGQRSRCPRMCGRQAAIIRNHWGMKI